MREKITKSSHLPQYAHAILMPYERCLCCRRDFDPLTNWGVATGAKGRQHTFAPGLGQSLPRRWLRTGHAPKRCAWFIKTSLRYFRSAAIIMSLILYMFRVLGGTELPAPGQESGPAVERERRNAIRRQGRLDYRGCDGRAGQHHGFWRRQRLAVRKGRREGRAGGH